MSGNTARTNWEIENGILLEDPDSYYAIDKGERKRYMATKPWKKVVNYFTHVRISAIALLKMVMHAKSGGNLEVMGIMQGKIKDSTFIILDAFALPVQGTETRVNAAETANEYLIEYIQSCEAVSRHDHVLGWYHSHPGYGCWLSGIDVETQALNQRFQEPWLAIVIDPLRTASAGKVDIGAFRTLPESSIKSQESTSHEVTARIPIEKSQDFGVHSHRYYALNVSFFKTSHDQALLDKLWPQYWIQVLAQIPTPPLTSHYHDLALKLKHLQKVHGTKKFIPELIQWNRACGKMCSEQIHTHLSILLKSHLLTRSP